MLTLITITVDTAEPEAMAHAIAKAHMAESVVVRHGLGHYARHVAAVAAGDMHGDTEISAQNAFFVWIETAYPAGDWDRFDTIKASGRDLIEEALLEAAATCEINDAARAVQDYVAQSDGGLAGIMLDEDIWNDISHGIRIDMLRSYMRAEFKHL